MKRNQYSASRSRHRRLGLSSSTLLDEYISGVVLWCVVCFFLRRRRTEWKFTGLSGTNRISCETAGRAADAEERKYNVQIPGTSGTLARKFTDVRARRHQPSRKKSWENKKTTKQRWNSDSSQDYHQEEEGMVQEKKERSCTFFVEEIGDSRDARSHNS